MLAKSLDSITAADILGLVANQVRESRRIDYKLKLPGNSDKDKKEFLADVCAFANSGGGDILYGIKEGSDDVGQPNGIPVEAIGCRLDNFDKSQLQFESVLRTGLAPRHDGIRIREIAGFPEGSVVLLRILPSDRSPHMITQKDSPFFGRSEAGKYAMNIEQIKASFLGTGNLKAEAEQFRSDRISSIKQGVITPRISAGIFAALHIVPVAALTGDQRLDLDQPELIFPSPLKSYGWGVRMNFDGRLVSDTADRDGYPPSYKQIFLDGRIEMVSTYIVRQQPGIPGSRIPSQAFEGSLLQAFKEVLAFYRHAAVQAPIYVMLSLVNASGFSMALSNHTVSLSIDRDDVLATPVRVDDLTINPLELLKAATADIWRAVGMKESPHLSLYKV